MAASQRGERKEVAVAGVGLLMLAPVRVAHPDVREVETVGGLAVGLLLVGPVVKV